MADTQQFSEAEFHQRVFNEDGFNTAFLLSVVNQICIDGVFTPLKWAIMNNHMDVFKYLIDHGADPTITGNEVVSQAITSGNLEAVQYLHEHGVDMTKLNNKVIGIAAKHGHVDVVTYLSNIISYRAIDIMCRHYQNLVDNCEQSGMTMTLWIIANNLV